MFFVSFSNYSQLVNFFVYQQLNIKKVTKVIQKVYFSGCILFLVPFIIG